MQYLGDFAEDATVYIPFNTFSSNDPQASVTITNLVDADIKVHKDGGLTQIATDGATIAIDFDSITGNHLITIDTSAHADYSIGSDYIVRIEGTTVDAGTINAFIGSFSIENRFDQQTGDSYARLGAPSGASVSADVADVPTVAELNARTLVAANYFDPTSDPVANVTLVETTTDLTNLPSIPTNWITGTGITASALDGKGDWNVGKTGYTLSQSFPTNFSSMVITAGGIVDSYIQGFLNTTIAETTGGRISNNFDTFYDNSDSVTTKTVDDVGVAGSGLTQQNVRDAMKLAPTSGAPTAGSVDEHLDDILADTGELQTDWVDGGRLDLLLGAIPTTAMRGTDSAALATALTTAQNDLDIITGVSGVNLLTATQSTIDATLVDTGTTIPALIAALNNISAAQVNAECDTAISDAALATAAALATVDTVADAIKVVTDRFLFTVANQVDSNIQSINDVTITGNGGTTPFDV